MKVAVSPSFEEGKLYEEKDFNRTIEIVAREAKRVNIFLDEANRGKPELNQCLMDMLLNRQLNGNALPDACRIFGAWNPIDDGFYQVEEPVPAWLDRWNVYTLDPSVEEWMDWAWKAGVNNNVIGFISEIRELLDPYTSSSKEILNKYKAGSVLPSRRSWLS